MTLAPSVLTSDRELRIVIAALTSRVEELEQDNKATTIVLDATCDRVTALEQKARRP